MTTILLYFLRAYKRFISPVLVPLFGKGCRFSPTCSQYSYEAISRFGLVKGGALSIKRFFRCNPFTHGYYDPVPERQLMNWFKNLFT